MTEAGIKSMADQINLTIELSQAAASKGLSGFQAQRDIIDLLNGKGDRTIFAKELGITDEDIKTATNAGELYGFLAEKLSAYGEAGAVAADSFGASSQRLSNEVQQLEGAVARPLFEVLKRSANELAAQLGSAEFQRSFGTVAEEIARVAGGAVEFGAKLLPLIPALAEVGTAVGALAVALGVGALITTLSNAIASAGGLGEALAALVPRIDAVLTALGPAGALLLAATSAMLLLEHATAQMESRTRSLLGLFATLDSQRSALDKQIAGADTTEKQQAAYAALDSQLTRLVARRELLRRTGRAADDEELVSVESEIGRTQARINQFERLAGAGASAEKALGEAAKYSGASSKLAKEFEEDREAGLSKAQTLQEVQGNYERERIANAKAFGLEESASYEQIQRAAQDLIGKQSELGKAKPQLIDTSGLQRQVEEAKRQFEVIKTAIQSTEKAQSEDTTGTSPTLSQVDPNYDLNVQTAETLTGKLADAQRALADAQQHNAEASQANTGQTRESNAAAEQQLKGLEALRFRHNQLTEATKAATAESIKAREADNADLLAKAKLAAGPGNTSPEIREREIASRELRYQAQFLQENGKLDDESIRKAHERAVAEVDVTLAKKAGAAATKEARQEARDLRSEEAAGDRDRATALLKIRDELADVKGDPFQSDAEKIPQEIRLLQQEQAQLQANIKARQAYIDAHQGDPQFAQKVAQYGQENQRDQRTSTQSGQQEQLLGGGGQIRSQITQLQSQWSLTSKNIGKDITQNIQTAVDGVSRGITGLITGTKNWKQAFADVGTSIIGSLVQIGVQMIASHVLGMILGKQAAQQQTQNNVQIASSGASAAAVTSISSYGVAAIVGTALAIAGIAAIIALATGAFAEGGLIPGAPSHSDNRIARVATGEYVIRTAAVQHYGPEFFDHLNTMRLPRTGFADGGLVGADDGYAPLLLAGVGQAPNVSVGGASVTLIQPRSKSEMLQALQSAEGRKIVLGHVAKNRHTVGIPT